MRSSPWRSRSSWPSSGVEPEGDRLFHIFYDGTVVDEDNYTVLGGGEADAIAGRVKDTYEPGFSLEAALVAAVAALAGSDRRLTAADLETAVLARGDRRRTFRRLTDAEVDAALTGGEVAVEETGEAPPPADEVATRRRRADTPTRSRPLTRPRPPTRPTPPRTETTASRPGSGR